ncbi:hypothetical protein HYQ45_007668 [Verticillium longisporum]
MAHNEHKGDQVLLPQEEREVRLSPQPSNLQTISPARSLTIEILSVKFATSLPPNASHQLLPTAGPAPVSDLPYKLELDFHIRYTATPRPVDIHLAILPHRILAQSLFHQVPPNQPDLQSYFLNQLAPLCYRDLDLNPSVRVLGRRTLERLTHHILLFCERHLNPVLDALADSGPVNLEPIPLVTNDVAKDERLGHSFVPGRGMPRDRATGDLQPVIPCGGDGSLDMEFLERVFRGIREDGTMDRFQPAWDSGINADYST